MLNEKPVLAFLGHHKAATTWMLRVINAICLETGLRHEHFHSVKMFDFDLSETIKDHKLDFFSYTNAEFKQVKPLLDKIRGYHLIRDPRDVVVSAYFSHLYSHSTRVWPELSEHRQELQSLSKEDGLLLTIESIDSIQLDGANLNALKSLSDWDYSCPNILTIRFEDLIVNPYNLILDIVDFLGILDDSKDVSYLNTFSMTKNLARRLINQLIGSAISFSNEESKINPHKLLSIVYLNDFKNITKGRKPGTEDVKHHFRKGQPGDWRNHFTEEHKKLFKEKYQELLVKLKYVENDEW